MLTNDERKYILREHLRNIHGISDKEYQKRVWIRGEGPECDDFTETVCHFFDDGDPILKKYEDYNITKTQYSILKKFRNEFESFCDSPVRPYLPDEFISTPEWTTITEMAKEVLKAFNYQNKEWTPPNFIYID